MKNLETKFCDRTATIGIIGLGYVGLPLLIRFSDEKFQTIGFDVDEEKVDMLNNGRSYIKHFPDSKIKSILNNKFVATVDFKNISNVDVVIICVPTPLGTHNEPNLSYIHSTIKSILPYIKKNQLLILESTTYPGTTEEEIIPVLSNQGYRIGEDYFVGYSPEREDPGNKQFSTQNIPKVVSGVTKNCLVVTQSLYKQIVDITVPVSSTKAAELTKILENIHRAVNIGLVNELKLVADKMDLDIHEIINAAATKPFGFTPYYPGPGLGGHCIPIDPYYLTWKAKEVGMNTRFIELAGEINTSMPNYVIMKSVEALNNVEKSIKNSKIFILGLAYKKNVDDLRESPSLVIIRKLIDMGAKIEYCDPFFEKIPPTRKYNIELKSKALNAKNIKSSDLVIIATDHDSFDYDLILKEANIIVDTRGRYALKHNKVIKA